MKIKVGLFFGGNSVEHEVSIISALQAKAAFDISKYDIIPIYIAKDFNMYVGEKIGDISNYKDIPSLIKSSTRVVLVRNQNRVELVKYPIKMFSGKIYDYIDVAFPVVHGTNVEDGTLQGYLHMLDLPYVGCDVLSSAVGMDKYVMKTILKDNDIPVLDCLVYTLKDYASVQKIVSEVENKISYPVIVKPIDLGSSVGIKKAKNKDELIEAVDYAFTFATKIIIERAIVNLREINCAVLGDFEDAIASECEEPVGSDEILSYDDKYVSGEKNKSGVKNSSGSKGMATLKRKLPADISSQKKKEIQELAVKTFQILGCNGVSRIDFMLDNDKVYVNEINTIPGSLAFYLWEATGIKYQEQLDKMIYLALKREREQKNVTYSFDTNILKNIKLGGQKGQKN